MATEGKINCLSFFRFPQCCLSQLALRCAQDISQHSHHSHQKTTCGSCSLPTLHWIKKYQLMYHNHYYYPAVIGDPVTPPMIASYPTRFPASKRAPCSDSSGSPWRRPFRSPWRVRQEFHRPRGQWPLRHGMCQRLGESNGWEDLILIANSLKVRPWGNFCWLNIYEFSWI